MKCRQCGKETGKKNRVCPHCGYVNSVENLLKKADIPSELDHLSTSQIKQHLKFLSFIKKHRYVFLIVILTVSAVTFSLGFFKDRRTVNAVPNFHDDLIEDTSSNALGNSISNIVNGGLLLQSGDSIYAADKNGISKITLALDKKELLFKVDAAYLNASENGFYYIDASDKNMVCFYDVTNNTVTKLNIQATQLTLVGDYLYYLEDNSNRAIYQMHKETLQTKKMTQSQCVQFKINGDWLYFATDEALYQMPVLGGEIMRISDTPYNHFVVDGQNIFYIDKATGYIHRVKKDGTENTVLVEDNCSCFLMTDRYIFYAKTNGGLIKQNRETGEISTLTNDITNRLHIAGTWIYYLTSTNEGRFVSVDENSEMITPVDVISES